MHKIALVGAGRIGRIHAANAASHPQLTLSHVVDPIAANAADVAASYGAQVSTLEAVLADKSVTGVVVASSTDTHLDYCIQAHKVGKAIFCEKPIDMDLNRARAASGTLAGARLFLGFNRRFDPNFQALKIKLEARTVGKLETLHIISNDPSPPPVSYVKVSGGLFKDMAIHDFDMARWLLGEEPSEVFAWGSCLVDPEIAKAGDIDTARAILKTPSGRMCVIANSRRSGFGYDQRIEAFGSAGMIHADNVVKSTVQVWTETGAQADQFQNFFLDRYADAYRAEMAHFAVMLTSAAKPDIGYADGVAALALAEAAAKSLQTGQTVKL
ncbi:MAG: inositol 2-dehydrogenase [Rhodospirillaceae bacterium]|nr:inositol 2-dehydrogenase [Rhodospirillaceae bacterium]